MELEAQGVTVVQEGRPIVDGASFVLPARTLGTIQGASGSGKSTLLRALARLVPLARGSVHFGGVDVQTMAPADARRTLAWVPQDPRMFEGTVADNVRAGPAFRGVTLADGAVHDVLARVGLASLATRRADTLSGGERLRVALARALANDPAVLLLDEPTASLDPANADRILDLVASLDASVLLVTHVEAHAARGALRWHMTDGVLA